MLEERLGRLDDAVARYREALALDPDLAPARSALERLYESGARWEDLCALLETELADLSSPAERIAQLFRMARLREERLGDLEGAAALYRRILELEPGSRVALPALGAVLGRLGRIEELAEVFLREADVADDPRRKVAFLQRRAELFDEHLDDPERACAAWEDVRGVAPGHLPAVRALGRLHARAARWEELAAMYRAEADAAADPAAAADLLHRIGELLERRMGRVDDAVVAYRETLTLAPAHLPALHALARIYRARGDDEHLVDVLRAQGAARVATVERAAPLAEAARIAEQRLGDPERAIEHYEEVLRIEPRFAPALRALDRLYAQTGRFDALAALRRSAPDSSPEERAERLLRLARLEADRTGDRGAALRALDELVAVVPGHPAALLLEVRLATDPDRRARARIALAEAGSEPEPCAALLAGAALELRPASARRAALARAAALCPRSAALAPEEERRLRDAGDHEGLARFYDACRAAASDPASRGCWSTHAAEAWELAGVPDLALAAFQAALEDAPASLPALRGARALFARRGDWAAVRSDPPGGGRRAAGSARRGRGVARGRRPRRAALPRPRRRGLGLPRRRGAGPARRRSPSRGSRRLSAPRARRSSPRSTRRGPGRSSTRAAPRRAGSRPRGPRSSRPTDATSALAALDRAVEARPDLAPALELRARAPRAGGPPRGGARRLRGRRRARRRAPRAPRPPPLRRVHLP